MSRAPVFLIIVLFSILSNAQSALGHGPQNSSDRVRGFSDMAQTNRSKAQRYEHDGNATSRGRSLVNYCSSHSDCSSDEYCYLFTDCTDVYCTSYYSFRDCGPCRYCFVDNDSITGSCPSKCSYADPRGFSASSATTLTSTLLLSVGVGLVAAVLIVGLSE